MFSEWDKLPIRGFAGVVLVLGASDTGKTTLVQWMNEQLSERKRDVSLLDGDPGQSTLGVPGTMTLLDSKGQTRSWFVGSTSPRGNMLSVLTGARRLSEAVPGDDTVLCDTTGLIEPSAGGLYLKRSLIDLLQPETVITLQRHDELEELLEPLRRRRDIDVYELTVSDDTTRKDREQRVSYRRKNFKEYFQNGSEVTVGWAEKAVWPKPDFERGQLVGLCAGTGFVKGLGIVSELAPRARAVTLYTPLGSPGKIDELRAGSLRIDVETYRDELLR